MKEAQQKTLLVVPPGSLYMNTSIDNMFVYTEFTKKKVFGQSR